MVTLFRIAQAEGRLQALRPRLAEALGLNHFTTWAAREVCIWSLAGGKAESADITLKASYDDVEALIFGDLSPATGFMRGQIKVDGSYTLLVFGFARKLSHETLAQLTDGLREITDRA